jgi:photosystem II stability/assembly factor-like uncharacterized protein
VGLAAFVILRSSGEPSSGSAWARLGTQDVHALRFLPGSTNRLLFGHHGGLLGTTDGGRTWTPGSARADAMSLSVPGGDRLVIAGHLVFQESRDGGATWADIPADLPSLDIHAFAQSQLDPDRMWAYLAGGGVYASADGGIHWTQMSPGHVFGLTAVVADGADGLYGIDPFAGLVRSADGGATWAAAGEPPASPVTSLAATADGRTLVLGGPDGLHRSDDGGATWRQVLQSRAVLASAISEDRRTLAAVTEDTAFYRSDDGGSTWPGPR